MQTRKVNFIFIFFLVTIFCCAQKQIPDSLLSLEKLKAKKIIEGYRTRVIKGEKMADLARQYSQDPGSSLKGGLYSGIKKGVMDPVFESVAFSLKQGQISPVFETSYGFHFIQLVQRRGDVLDLRHILIVPEK